MFPARMRFTAVLPSCMLVGNLTQWGEAMQFRKLLVISVGHMSCDINRGALPSLLPYLAAMYGFNYQTAGGLMFAYAVVSSIVQPFFGLMADRSSRPWFVPLGVLLAGLGVGLSGYLENYWAIFFGLMISGVGAALFHPEGARYANRISGSHKGMGLSIFSVGGNSGFVLGPLVVTVSTALFGLHGTAAFSLLALVMAGILMQLLVLGPSTSGSGAVIRSAEEERGVNNWRAFGVLMVALMARSVLFLTMNSYIPFYWVDVFGTSKTSASLVLAFFCGVGVTFNVLGGILADRIGFSRVVRLSYCLSIPSMSIFPFLTSPWLAALMLVPVAIGLFAPFSSLVVLGQKYLARNVGFASGMTLGVAMTAGGIVTPLLGRVADLYGGLPSALMCLIPVVLAGGTASLFLRDPAVRPSEEQED